MELIRLENVSKIYGTEDAKVEALKEVSLSISEGELVAIIGSSGSGKSTLLNIIGCIDKPTSGNYFIEGNNVTQLKDKQLAKTRNNLIGFILQYFGLIQSYTAYENIELPLRYSKVKDKKNIIMRALYELGIAEKKDNLPSELSGGQNQRVAIARALVNNPKIILADEPTGALDKNTSKQVMELLIGLNKKGKTVIIITHDEYISNQCNRIIKIEDGEIKDDVKGGQKK